MGKIIAVGVNGSDIGELLHHSMALSERNKNYPMGAIAALLTCAELSILLAHEHWFVIEDEGAIIELMRKKAKETARDMLVEFKKFDASQGPKSDRLRDSGHD